MLLGRKPNLNSGPMNCPT